ncbi:MAG TPA: SRPBCC family protein [Kofleriaceae bacterium]
MTLIHDTFTLDRTYDAAPAEVWRAWTDPELRPRWFHGPEGWQVLERKLDLRVGGNERLVGRMPNGTETRFVSTFHVIVPEQHIVSAYDMHVGGVQLSVTLATLDLEAAGRSTRLRYTEQGVYLDGNPESPVGRKRGTSWHLDNLAKLF